MPYFKGLHVSAPLSNIAIAYENKEFIADRIFKKDLMVTKEADLITVYDEARRIEEAVRANGGVANQVKFGYSHEPYALIVKALREIITDRDRQNADSVMSLDIDTTKFIMELMKLNEEKDVADFFFSNGWASSESRNASTSWDPANTSIDPTGEVDDIASDIRKLAGVRPNLCILGDETLVALKNNTKVLDRIKYAEKAIITVDLIAALFDLPEVLVGSQSYNTAKEGVTDSFDFLWGPDAWFGYMAPVVGKRTYTAATRLRLKGKQGGYQVKKYREEAREGDWIEAQTASKPHMTADRCGYFVENAGLGS